MLDPAKVTRSGLTNACSIAGIMLTTQVRGARFGCAALGGLHFHWTGWWRCCYLLCRHEHQHHPLWALHPLLPQAVMTEQKRKKEALPGMSPGGMPAGLTM